MLPPCGWRKDCLPLPSGSPAADPQIHRLPFSFPAQLPSTPAQGSHPLPVAQFGGALRSRGTRVSPPQSRTPGEATSSVMLSEWLAQPPAPGSPTDTSGVTSSVLTSLPALVFYIIFLKFSTSLAPLKRHTPGFPPTSLTIPSPLWTSCSLLPLNGDVPWAPDIAALAWMWGWIT